VAAPRLTGLPAIGDRTRAEAASQRPHGGGLLTGVQQRAGGREVAQRLHDAGGADVRLDAAPAAAAAEPAVQHQRGVAPLAGGVAAAAVQGPAERQPGADPGAQVDHRDVVVAAGRPGPQLGDHGRPQRVVEIQRQVQRAGQQLPQRHVVPVPVRREHRDAALPVHLSRHAHAGAEHRGAVVAGQHGPDAVDDVRHDLTGLPLLRPQRVLGAGQSAQRGVEEVDVHVRLGDVDAEQQAAGCVRGDQPARASAAGVLPAGLGQQAQPGQLADQGGHGGQAQPGGRRDALPGGGAGGQHVLDDTEPVGGSDVPRRACHALSQHLRKGLAIDGCHCIDRLVAPAQENRGSRNPGHHRRRLREAALVPGARGVPDLTREKAGE
jgi:hypothetical protein